MIRSNGYAIARNNQKDAIGDDGIIEKIIEHSVQNMIKS